LGVCQVLLAEDAVFQAPLKARALIPIEPSRQVTPQRLVGNVLIVVQTVAASSTTSSLRSASILAITPSGSVI
jgi:hypothetical protein